LLKAPVITSMNMRTWDEVPLEPAPKKEV
jgi:hypothetical protein